MGRRRGAQAVVVAGVVGAAFVGGSCTAGSEPTPTASSSITPAPSPTSTPSPAATPTTPSDDDQAIAAAQRYVTLLNDATRTGNSAALRRAFDPGCIVCTSDADAIDATARAGRLVEGGEVTFTEVRVESVPDPIRRILVGQVSEAASVLRDAAGGTVDAIPASSTTRRVIMVRGAGGWLVEGVAAG